MMRQTSHLRINDERSYIITYLVKRTKTMFMTISRHIPINRLQRIAIRERSIQKCYRRWQGYRAEFLATSKSSITYRLQTFRKIDLFQTSHITEYLLRYVAPRRGYRQFGYGIAILKHIRVQTLIIVVQRYLSTSLKPQDSNALLPTHPTD